MAYCMMNNNTSAFFLGFLRIRSLPVMMSCCKSLHVASMEAKPLPARLSNGLSFAILPLPPKGGKMAKLHKVTKSQVYHFFSHLVSQTIALMVLILVNVSHSRHVQRKSEAKRERIQKTRLGTRGFGFAKLQHRLGSNAYCTNSAAWVSCRAMGRKKPLARMSPKGSKRYQIRLRLKELTLLFSVISMTCMWPWHLLSLPLKQFEAAWLPLGSYLWEDFWV